MLDVDGHVIEASDLVERVEQLVREVHKRNPPPPEEGPPPTRVPNAVPAQGRLELLRSLHAELTPPQLSEARTVRAGLTRFTKRVVRKMTRWYVEPRWLVQANFDATSIDVATVVMDEIERVKAEIQGLQRENTRLKLQVVGSVERLVRHQRDLDQALDRLAPGQVPLLAGGDTSRHYPDLMELDYVSFEDRCRGSSEDVQSSQRRYISCFPPPVEGSPIVDIGCGRGEMLELLREAGYDVLGVDSDPGMIEVCRAKHLPVVKDDALHFLGQTGDDTLRGIFCAQVVEHMTTPDMEHFIQLTLRKLLPNGVLVVETINPRSSFALGNHFFADVSHVRPVHPETLRFICEQVGFRQVQMEERSPHAVMAMAEDIPSDASGSAIKALLQSVFGFQDYAIVATK